MWLLLALLSAVFAALVTIFAKIGIQKIDSNVATFVRVAVMFVTMFAVVLVSGKLHQITAVHGKALTFIILSGLAGAASYVCYFLALRLGLASHVAAVDKLSLVFITLFAAIFLAEKINFTAGIGIALISVGTILVALK